MNEKYEYALLKIDNSDLIVLGKGKRSFITKFIDNSTNSIGFITYIDMITGEKIKPHYTDDLYNEHYPNGLTYYSFKTIDRKAAIEYLENIKQTKIQEYIDKITLVKNKLNSKKYFKSINFFK